MTAHRAYQGGVLTRRDYRDADRLLRDVMANSHGQRYFETAGLLCWLEDTKPQRREPDLLTVMFACAFLLFAFITAVFFIEWALR